MKDFYRLHETTIQFFGFMAIVATALAVMMLFMANEQEDHYRAAYPVWVKMTGLTNISYEEWRSLKRVENETESSQVVPMPIIIPMR